MELKHYFLLIKKWRWLLTLGLLCGLAGGYILSLFQPTVYETKTRMMVSRALDQQGTTYYFWNDIQLAATYSQLINTQQVLNPLSERVGYPVRSDQINVRHIPDSLLLEVTVTDDDAQQVAEIANTLVEVFIEYNDNLQNQRYQASERTLQEQIDQVKKQIDDLQAEIELTSQQEELSLQAEQDQAFQQRLAELKKSLEDTEAEIIKVEDAIAAFYPTPIPPPTPLNPFIATATPLPTPTLTQQEYIALREEQNHLDQLQTLRQLYKETYAKLVVLGSTGGTSNQDRQARLDQQQATLALYQQIYTTLLDNLESIRLAKYANTPTVVQIEEAVVPSKPIQPQPLRSSLLGALSGLLIMASISFLTEYLDDTVKTPEDIERFFNLPIIGFIGEIQGASDKENNGAPQPEVFTAEHPLSPIAEAFRTLRTNLDFAGVDKPLKSLVITSTSPEEGKTTIAINLAIVMAQGERKVMLVDADLRRPAIHRAMNLPNGKGISDVFRDQMKLEEVIEVWGEHKVQVLTTGSLPPNPVELLSSSKMDLILQALKARSDILILDTPPCILADPIVLSSKADGVVLVVQPGKSRLSASKAVLEQLERAGARLVGVVFNSASQREAQYYSHYYYSSYYYSRYYGNYFGENGEGKSNGKTKLLGLGRRKGRKKQPSPPES